MATDTQYAPIEYIFASRGLVARPIDDQTPPQTYLNLDSAEERQENAMSSRYGSIIINRSPNGTVGGTNFLLPNEILTLTRLKYNASSWRYAGDVTGALWRRTGDTQGAYTQIETGLSGQRFSSVVLNCFGSSQPFLFIADASKMLKDTGTGSPTQWGITPPFESISTIVYPPNVFLIDGFNNSPGGYTTSNVSGWAAAPFGTIVTTGVSASYPIGGLTANLYASVTSGFRYAFNGCLATFGTSTMPTFIAVATIITTNLVSGIYQNLQITTETAHGLSVGSVVQLTGTTAPYLNGNYTVSSVTSSTIFSVAAATLGLYNYTSSNGGEIAGFAAGTHAKQALLFNVYGNPNPVQFSAIGVNGPLDLATTNFPIETIGGTVAASTGAYVGKTVSMDLSQGAQTTTDDLIVLCLQLDNPANVATVTVDFDLNGSGYTAGYYSRTIPLPPGTSSQAYITYYERMGDFTEFGQAGTEGWNWANVTGWRVTLVTNSTGSCTFSLNALYQQWGYGPSSFGGVGYDFRYTYFDNNTKTESNGSPIQEFSQQYGYVASLSAPIALRQAIWLLGMYSLDPQVTHVRIYMRGGTLSSNWFLADQIPNIPALSTFSYAYLIPDSELAEASPLVLDNDQPVTSSLQNPIYTTLLAPINVSVGFNSPYETFGPSTVTVPAIGATFLPGQLVDVGTPLNLEQVAVVTGGANTFTAVFRLQHNAGEPVYVFSIPGQACDLVAEAYGQLWVAGDPNNPHYLYYSNPGYPENFGPQNYIPVGTPDSPIMAIINFRGTLCVATLTTWYLIIGGTSPYAQPTGSNHGLVSKFGWTLTESAILYQANDGIREFRGADGAYLSILIEWLYRQTPQSLTPVPLPNLSDLGNVIMAFQNNDAFSVYTGQDGNQHRLCWNTTYKRWRNDDVNATAIYTEEDTNLLLYAKYMTAGAQSGYAIVQDRVNDYDDGGWVSGALVETPIDVTIQLPYQDLKKPHFPKQWNMVEVDANTQGQSCTIILNFDDGIAPITLAPFSTTQRQKVQLIINAGDGIESYKMSPELQIDVTTAPIIYQLNVYAALLAANRSSWDTYWFKWGSEESKLVKEIYFDYTSSSAITVKFYADGQTVPYYTETLPTNTARLAVPERVRLPAIKCRMWRCVATCTQGNEFQFWSAPQVDQKPCLVGRGYEQSELVV